MPTGHEGTGKHGHKDTEEPWPHTREHRQAGGRDEGSRESRSDGRSQSGSDGGSRGGADGSSRQASSREERESLERREYRDDKGEVHHHTRTYEEQHKGDRRR